jgi:TPR repeat protein
MREAGDRGVPEAQLALGRFYLSGVEEMGADPAEAEKWLSLAAARGDKEAEKLLAEASSAKKTEQERYQWRQFHRQHWLGWWATGYPYHWYWSTAGWYYR